MVVGSAEIIVRAITKQVRQDIKRAFDDTLPDVAKAGRESGEVYSDEFGKSIDKNLRPALESSMTRAAKDASASVGREFSSSLPNQVERPAAVAGRRAGAALSRGLASGSRGGGGGGFLSWLEDALFRVPSRAKRASDSLTQLTGIGTLLTGAIAGLVGMLSSAASGLYILVGAAMQAAGAIAVLPGIISVAAQAMGTLRLAFSGVGEAIKAGAKVQDVAAQSTAAGGKAAGDATKANEALIRAQERLKMAQEAARRAQDALNRAQDRAKDSAEGSILAQQLLAGAEQERQKTLSDPNATATDGATAQKAVDDAVAANKAVEREKEESLRRLRNAEERDANARRAVEDAERARDRAREAAKNKAAAAKSPAVKAADDYRAALNKLTPAAQEFVDKILQMRKIFQDIGKEVQEEFFKPINDGLDALIRSDFFPHLRRHLPESGRILGQIGKQILITFSNTANMERFGKILEGNNEILDVFNQETEHGQTPMQGLVDIVMKLALAIQPLTKRFVTWIGTLVTGINTSKAFTEEGALVTYFEKAGDIAAQLGRTFGNIWTALRNIGIAGQESGEGLLTSFENATQKFEEWSAGLIGDEAAEQYFADVAWNLEQIGGLINTIVAEFVKLGDNKGIGEMASSLEPAVVAIGGMLDNFNTNGESLGRLATTVAEITEAFADTEGIGLFLDTMNLLMTPIKWFLQTSFGKWILGITGAFFAVSRAVQFTRSIFGIFFKGIVGGWLSTIEAIKRQTNNLKNIFKKAEDDVPEAEDLAPDETEAADAGERVGRALAEGLGTGIESTVTEVQRATDTLLDAILESFDGAKPLWEQAGKDASSGFAEGIRANFTEVATAGADLGDEALQALKEKLDIQSPSRVFQQQGEYSGEGYVDGVREEIDNARRAGADLAGAAADGAASQEITANVSTTASAAASDIDVTGGLPDLDLLDEVDLKTKDIGISMEETGKKSGRMRGGFAALGGGIKALGGGLLGLVGGPLGAITLLITGLTMLYKKSPEFKKFVDTIVKSVMPVVKAIGGWFLGILEKLFKWINKHLPTMKTWFSTTFSAIKDAFSSAMSGIKSVWDGVLSPVFSAIQTIFMAVFTAVVEYLKFVFNVYKSIFNGIKSLWNNVLKPVFNAIKTVFMAVFKGVVAYFKTVFNVYKTIFNNMKTVWNNVLKPVFTTIKNVAKDVFESVGNFINKMRDTFVTAKDRMNTVKNAIVDIFDKIKSGAKTPVKWVIDTVWNNGIVKMAGKIPGVNSDGWSVNTSGWATGGWTGPGAKYDVAGLVHADEFVINKAARRSFEARHPGLLDHINRTGNMPGYSLGGKVLGWGKKAWKKGSEKFKAAKDQVVNIINWVRNVPGSISNNMSTDWGKTLQGIPKATANAFIRGLNDILPHALPKVPIGEPFPGVQFRANGGPVSKGMPYVVGERRPELFIPDEAGKIIPSLSHPEAKKAIESILRMSSLLGDNVDMSRSSSTNTVNSGSRNMTVNINNPTPERSSQSVTRVVRSKAFASGWSV